MGHRHLLEPTAGGTRLTNTIYIAGPLTAVWRRILGPRAARTLADAQRAAAELAAPGPPGPDQPAPTQPG